MGKSIERKQRMVYSLKNLCCNYADILHFHPIDTNQSHTSTLMTEGTMLFSHVYLYTEALCLLGCAMCEDHS